MNTKFPKNNLAPASQPWGRDIERRLQELELGNSVALNRNANTNAGVQAILNNLTDQVSTINTAVANITTLQGQMATQISGLSSAVADISSLQNKQVALAQNGGARSNFSLSTSGANIYSLSVTVPSGYSRAIVFVVTNMTLVNSTASGKYSYLKANINSSSMAAATEMYSAANDVRAFGSSASAVLTGLSAGGTITASATAYSSSATAADTANNVTLDVIAIFLV